MKLLVTLIAALLLSAILTRVFLSWVERRNIGADANHRSMHKGTVATGGGLPLLAAGLLTAALMWPLPDTATVVLPCLAVLALVSWIDDLTPLPAPLRFAVQLAAVGLTMYAIPNDMMIFQGAFSYAPDRIIAGIAALWFLNLYNFMDGIDGIAAIETAAIALGYVVVLYAAGVHATHPLVPLAMAIGGAALGFLNWNWHPAKIFMGDVGAIPLGFLMGWLMLDLALAGKLAAAVILPLYFSADATLTLIKRVLAKEKPWHAHRQHAYQRAALAAGRHDGVVRQVTVCNVALIVYAVLSLVYPWFALVLAAASVAILFRNLEGMARTDATAPATA